MKNIAYLFLLGLYSFITSCGNEDNNKKDSSALEDKAVASYKQLPEIKIISKEKLAEINKWKEFRELSNLMEKFQNQNSGDLTYYAEEFIRLNNEIEKDSLFPQKFNVPDVKSRLIVFKTFSNQFKTRLDENAPIDSINASREKLLTAYNAIRRQLSEVLKSKIYQDFIKEK